MSKNNDWINLANDLLGMVSDFAHKAAESISNNNKSEKQIVDYNDIAKHLAENKAAWWKIILKYIGGGLLFVSAFAIALLSFRFYIFTKLLITLSIVFMLPSAGLIISAENDRKLNRIIKEYIPVIGMRPEVSIKYLCDSFNRSVKTVKRDIRKLLASKVFPEDAYYDKKLEILVLDGYKEPDTTESNDFIGLDIWINKLSILELGIKSEIIKNKLSKLSTYLHQIKEYISANPEREKMLRTFVNYYLPTTVKLAESYKNLEKMGDVGENIAETKAKIESSLDSLAIAYKNQLESLCSIETMDISSDIDVLETMIKRDGLDK